MARCEDFLCCGHEPGCCPDFDGAGRQLNMVCTCGAKLPLSSRYSICDSCMRRASMEDGEFPPEWEHDDREDQHLDRLPVKVDFSCRDCGAECPVAPDPPGRAVCEDCCEDHDYKYDPHRRGRFCEHCDKQLEDG